MGSSFTHFATRNRYTEVRVKEDVEMMDVLMTMEQDAARAERERDIKAAAKKNAEFVEVITESRLAPKLRIDANGKVVRDGAARSDENERIRKMHAQKTAKRKASEVKQAEKDQRARGDSDDCEIVQLVDMSEEKKSGIYGDDDDAPIPKMIRAPKRKKGEKPNIYAASATYSQLINVKRTRKPSGELKKGNKKKPPTKAAVIEVQPAASSRLRNL